MALKHVPKHLRLPCWLAEAVEEAKDLNRRSFTQQVVVDLETIYGPGPESVTTEKKRATPRGRVTKLKLTPRRRAR